MAPISKFKVIIPGFPGCFLIFFSSFLLSSAFILSASINCFADNIELHKGTTYRQNHLFNKIVQSSNGKSPSLSSLMDYFTGAPYIPHTLDNTGSEKLIVRFDAFDCVTYVETVTALALMYANADQSYESFRKHLTKIRYRNGTINGYPSRLHYFSDWIFENERQGYISNITKELGGKPDKRKINAMSNHRERYPVLKEKSQMDRIKTIEANLSKRTFYYLETKDVKNISHLIPDGAIIAIVTSNRSIFISHVGFARIVNGTVKLQHASYTKKRVVVSEKSLYDYLNSDKKRIGIMIAILNI